jgi:hypothetical protein
LSSFEDYLEAKENYLDSFIADGSDQDLFVASYIHGHFSVVAANLVASFDTDDLPITGVKSNDQHHKMTQAFNIELKTCIENAISKGELSSKDSVDVRNMLSTLLK